MSTTHAKAPRHAYAQTAHEAESWERPPRNGVAVHAQRQANAAFMAQMKAQRQAREAQAPPDTLAIAAQGVEGSARSLPHLDVIQRAFGRHDVSGVRAHVGGTAKAASEAIGAEAYATGNDIAFRQSPSLHTAAHEAAHVVQQRAGVSLPGGVGAVGDAYEQHADRVADAVVRGESAEGLLDEFAGGGGGGAVQMRPMYPTGHRTQGVAQRPIGTFRYRKVDGDDPRGTKVPHFPVRPVRLTTRSVRAWRHFLAYQASKRAGSVELVVFMARALGMNSLSEFEDPSQVGGALAEQMGEPFGVGSEAREMRQAALAQGQNGFAGLTRITEHEAMALMEALLTVGSDINLGACSA